MNPYVPEKLPLTSIRWEDTYRERNRSVYYGRLKAISSDGDWNGWIRFFLSAVIDRRRLKIIKKQERSWTFTTG